MAVWLVRNTLQGRKELSNSWLHNISRMHLLSFSLMIGSQKQAEVTVGINYTGTLRMVETFWPLMRYLSCVILLNFLPSLWPFKIVFFLSLRS
jgi:hypothetical protein